MEVDRFIELVANSDLSLAPGTERRFFNGEEYVTGKELFATLQYNESWNDLTDLQKEEVCKVLKIMSSTHYALFGTIAMIDLSQIDFSLPSSSIRESLGKLYRSRVEYKRATSSKSENKVGYSRNFSDRKD